MKFRVHFDSEVGSGSVRAFDDETGDEVDLNQIHIDVGLGVAYVVLVNSEDLGGGARLYKGTTCYPRQPGKPDAVSLKNIIQKAIWEHDRQMAGSGS